MANTPNPHITSTQPSSPNTALPETLPALIRHTAARSGSRSAIVDGSVTISYAELLERSQQVARALITLGIQAGDRVAIWAPNIHEWILAACGIHAAGAVLLPLNTRLKGLEVIDILTRSRATALFCIGNFLNHDYPAMLDAGRPATLRHTIVFRHAAHVVKDVSLDLPWDDFLLLGHQTDLQQVAMREKGLTAQSTSDLIFTSGTTGRPKGVMCAHGPTIAAFQVWSDVVGLNEDDHYLIVNPFFHCFGYKAGWVAAFIRGATVYPAATFDADGILQRIQTDRISFMPGPPTLYLSMLAHPRLHDFDLSSLKSAVTGAATVPPVLIHRMREELGITNVTTAYGLTECGGCATVCEPSDSVETVAQTCGHALPGTEVRCVDELGNDVQTGQPGEVLLRGYHIMQGYFDDEEATRAALDTEGWLHTGDIGVLDARGYLCITDRLKDMFIVGGFNCYPAEIERVLSEHPGIAQVAVVGVPDERMGEVGCACIITRDSKPLVEHDLLQWSRERMANYKVPRHVLNFAAFPLNLSNKVLKRELAALATQQLFSP